METNNNSPENNFQNPNKDTNDKSLSPQINNPNVPNNTSINDKNSKGVSYLFTAAKAGMEGLNREEIDKIITDATKNTRMAKKNEEDLKILKEKIEKKKKALELFHNNESLYEHIKKMADSRIEILKKNRTLDKIWMHLDMDMFFAAVEIKDNPELANVPMAVGGLQMISTSNYIARKFGVRSAMPGFLALKLCPQLKIVDMHFDRYKEESQKMMKVLKEYDTELESMGLDEAYLDLTGYCRANNIKTKEEICALVQEIKNKIFNETQLTCSVGIACNKTLAKICSDYKKPNGLYFLEFDYEFIENFMEGFNIRKIPFLGQKTEQKLNLLDIFTCKDLKERYIDIYYLFEYDSSYKHFDFFMSSVFGLGSTEHHVYEDRKSISHSESFKLTGDINFIKSKFEELANRVYNGMKKEDTNAKTLTIEVIDLTERKIAKSHTGQRIYEKLEDIKMEGWKILEAIMDDKEKIRMIRVKVSNLIKFGEKYSAEEKESAKFLENWLNEYSSGNKNTNQNENKDRMDDSNNSFDISFDNSQKSKKDINTNSKDIKSPLIKMKKDLAPNKNKRKSTKGSNIKNMDIQNLLNEMKNKASLDQPNINRLANNSINKNNQNQRDKSNIKSNQRNKSTFKKNGTSIGKNKKNKGNGKRQYTSVRIVSSVSYKCLDNFMKVVPKSSTK